MVKSLKPQVGNDRCSHLSHLSGLLVTCQIVRGGYVFTFGTPEQPVKSVFTYRKAKAFAEGIRIGRTLSD